MAILSILSLIVHLLPLVAQLVQQAEAVFPEQGSGAHKLELVRSTLEAAYTTANTTETAFHQVWPALNGAISATVAGYKAIKGGSAPVAAPAAATAAPVDPLPAGAAIAQPALA